MNTCHLALIFDRTGAPPIAVLVLRLRAISHSRENMRGRYSMLTSATAAISFRQRATARKVEYELLKNGLVMRNQEGHQEVRVLTDEDGAKQITDFAARACPEVLPSVAVISEPVKSVSQPGGWVFKGARL